MGPEELQRRIAEERDRIDQARREAREEAAKIRADYAARAPAYRDPDGQLVYTITTLEETR